MFKELFVESDKKETFDAYVGAYKDKNGIDILDLNTGEAETFKNMKDLVSSIQKNPRDYAAFYRKSPKILKQEASDAGSEYEDSLEPVMVKIEVYPSWAKSVGIV